MNWKGRLSSLGGRFLGAVLLLAALAKAWEPGAFAQQIELEGLDFLFSAPTTALLALALETALGTVLLLGLRPTWILASSGLLVAFFLFLTGRNYWLVTQGLRDAAACGCFGTLLERTPAEAFWQDLLLLVPALLLACWDRRPPSLRWAGARLALAPAIATTVVVLTAQNPDLRFVQLASEVAAESRQRRYLPAREYHLLLGEARLPGEVYQSEDGATLLVLSPRLKAAVLLDPRTNSVKSLPAHRIGTGESGSLQVPVEERFSEAGEFRLDSGGISFQLEGLGLRLISGDGS